MSILSKCHCNSTNHNEDFTEKEISIDHSMKNVWIVFHDNYLSHQGDGRRFRNITLLTRDQWQRMDSAKDSY